MKDLGKARSLLGMEIIHDQAAKWIMLRQEGKIAEALINFSMDKCHPCSTPMEVKLKFEKVSKTKPEHARLPYRSLVGTLSHLANTTRPDINFAVNILSRHVNAYNKSHWLAAKHVLRYLKGTKDLGLSYSLGEGSSTQPIGYCDADWGNDVED